MHNETPIQADQTSDAVHTVDKKYFYIHNHHIFLQICDDIFSKEMSSEILPESYSREVINNPASIIPHRSSSIAPPANTLITL